MQVDDRTRIVDMIEACEKALRVCKGRNRRELDSDETFQLAIVRAIELVGEAASRVSRETREICPEIPWAAIVAMRHRLIHAYNDINPETVWKTATVRVPELLPQLRALLLAIDP